MSAILKPGVLIVVALAVGLAAAGYFLFERMKLEQQASESLAPEQHSVSEEKQAKKEERPEVSNKSENPERQIIKPTFDIVRVEPDGQTLIAGQAQPNSAVIVENNGTPIAETKADIAGAFVALPSTPLTGENNEIRIRTRSEDGTETVSDQAVAVAILGDKQPLVAVLEPGKPVTVLQRPEAEPQTSEPTVTTKARQAEPEPASPADKTDEINIARTEERPAPQDAPETDNSSKIPATTSDESSLVLSEEGNGEIEGESTSTQQEKAATSETQTKQTAALKEAQPPITPDQPEQPEPQQDQTTKRIARIVEPQEIGVPKEPVAQVDKTQDNTARDQEAETASIAAPSSTDTAQKQALTSPEATQPEAPALSVEAVEVENENLFIAGAGAPDSVVRIYVDGDNLGDIKADENGRWLYENNKTLKPGKYSIRVDQINEKNGNVSARAEVPFVVEDLSPADLVSDASAPKISNVIIRRNDNLWTIAKRLYGDGARYTAIYQKNRDQIRDPSLIFPGQVFTLPEEGLVGDPSSSDVQQ